MISSQSKLSLAETKASLHPESLNAFRSSTNTNYSYTYLLYWKFTILYQQNILLHLSKFEPWGLDYPTYFTSTYYRAKWISTIKLHIQKNHTIATFDFSKRLAKCLGWLFILFLQCRNLGALMGQTDYSLI